jgi:hypothetical protein
MRSARDHQRLSPTISRSRSVHRLSETCKWPLIGTRKKRSSASTNLPSIHRKVVRPSRDFRTRVVDAHPDLLEHRSAGRIFEALPGFSRATGCSPKLATGKSTVSVIVPKKQDSAPGVNDEQARGHSLVPDVVKASFPGSHSPRSRALQSSRRIARFLPAPGYLQELRSVQRPWRTGSDPFKR